MASHRCPRRGSEETGNRRVDTLPYYFRGHDRLNTRQDCRPTRSRREPRPGVGLRSRSPPAPPRTLRHKDCPRRLRLRRPDTWSETLGAQIPLPGPGVARGGPDLGVRGRSDDEEEPETKGSTDDSPLRGTLRTDHATGEVGPDRPPAVLRYTGGPPSARRGVSPTSLSVYFMTYGSTCT